MGAQLNALRGETGWLACLPRRCKMMQIAGFYEIYHHFLPALPHPWLWPNTDAHFSWQYTGRSILWEGSGPGFATNSCITLSKLLHPVASLFSYLLSEDGAPDDF